MVDGEELTIQLVFPSTPDWNGVGGITMEGRITKYDITEGKENKPVEIKMYASGTTMGAVTLFFSIDFGKFAKVRYSDIQGLKLTFSGAFVALEESGVFKSLNTN